MKTNKNALQYFDLIKDICATEDLVRKSDLETMTPKSELKTDLGMDSLDLATILVKLSDMLHVEFDILLPNENIKTVSDVCALVNEKFYKHNAIKQHVFEKLFADMSTTLSYKDPIPSSCQGVFLNNVIYDKFKVHIDCDLSTVKNIGALCDRIAKEIIEKQKMISSIKKDTKKNHVANAYDNAREQTIMEISGDLAKTDMVDTSKPDNINSESDIHFNSVYDKAEISVMMEKMYGVKVSDKLSRVKKVGDLCDIVIKTRLKQFQSLKYNSKQK